MASKVYFTDLHTTPSLNLCGKLERLVRKAGIEKLGIGTMNYDLITV